VLNIKWNVSLGNDREAEVIVDGEGKGAVLGVGEVVSVLSIVSVDQLI